MSDEATEPPQTEEARVVLVTGGMRGIGRATALRFAEDGCFVAVADRDTPDAELLVEELCAAGGQGTVTELDITDLPELRDWVADIGDRHGRIDVLINNAGIVRDAMLVKKTGPDHLALMSDADFDAVIDINLRGVFLCTRAVVPWMIQGEGGVVLNASSIVGIYGNYGQTNYAAAKAGVIGMTRTWARELGKHNIRVNAVAPGFVDTEMLQSIPAERLEKMAASVPLQRLGHVRDVAEAYAWLASDRASYINGQILGVDGGAVLGTG